MLARLSEVWWVALAGLSLVYITFWSSAEAVEVLTLLLATATLGWFLSVPGERLVNTQRKVNGELLLLAGVIVLLVGGTAVLIRTGTLLLALLLAVVAWVVGFVRALRHGLAPKGP